MKILLKHVQPLGFKGSGMYSAAQFHSHFYKVCETKRRVVIVGNTIPQTICRFDLSASNFRAFKAGTLVLVPPNCVCATGARALTKPDELLQREIKNKRQLIHCLEHFMTGDTGDTFDWEAYYKVRAIPLEL